MNKLRIYRKMKGLTLDEVAERLNGLVSKQAISKYERGLMSPSAKVLSALMSVYGIDNNESDTYSYELTSLNFRRGKRLSAKSESVIKNKITYLLENYLTLETELGLGIPFSPPFPKSYPVSMANMEKAAVSIRKKWGLGTDVIPYVCRMLEQAGIKVLEFEMEEGIDGLSGWVNHKIPFITLRKDVKIDRKRFTALHELAHLLFFQLEHFSENEKERLCHRFASSLLFPFDAFMTHVGKRRNAFSLEELITLKSIYGISIAAIVHRAKDLEVITDAYYNHLFDNVINKNKMEDGWGTYSFDDKPNRYNEIYYRGIAEGIPLEKIANKGINLELKIL